MKKKKAKKSGNIKIILILSLVIVLGLILLVVSQRFYPQKKFTGQVEFIDNSPNGELPRPGPNDKPPE